MKCSHLDCRVSLECTIVLKETAKYLGAHDLCHNEMWLWWCGTVFESWSIMWKYYPDLLKTLYVINIISLMKLDPSESLSACTGENLFNSLAVPLGFALISQYPYNYVFHNWFWQNIHTGAGRTLSLELHKSLDTSSKNNFV